MSTVFDYIDSILYSKKYVDDIKYDENQYSYFMVNRWISMSDYSAAQIINESSNRYWSVLMHREDHYKLLMHLMPSQKKKRIDYIKKNKEEKAKQSKLQDEVLLFANSLELSKKELSQHKYVHELLSATRTCTSS